MRLNSPQINIIMRACNKASRSLIRDFGEVENLQVSSKGPGDFVTSADKRTEKTIIEELQKAHSDYGIITEESGIINKSNIKNRWIIDPIDGTMNFLNGIPHFAISIAYEEDNEIKLDNSGEVADYIPQLKNVNSELFGISFVSIDGQVLEIGDTDSKFCVQSCSKPITYGIVLNEYNDEIVHNFVGKEPSGRNFNELCLNEDGLPHNPLINSGAIMTTSLIKPNLSLLNFTQYPFSLQ